MFFDKAFSCSCRSSVGMRLILLTSFIGCREFFGSTDLPEDAKASSAAVDPEKSFSRVVQRFRDRFSDFDVVLPLPFKGVRKRVRFRFVVDDIAYQVHPSSTQQDHYTATLTVRTSTRFSMMRSEEGRAEDRDSFPQTTREATDYGAANTLTQQRPGGFSDTTPSRKSENHQLESDMMNTLSQQGVTSNETYDFAYERGSWVVKSEIADPSTRDIIEYALKRQ